jgi:hypothetical protein
MVNTILNNEFYQLHEFIFQTTRAPRSQSCTKLLFHPNCHYSRPVGCNANTADGFCLQFTPLHSYTNSTFFHCPLIIWIRTD